MLIIKLMRYYLLREYSLRKDGAQIKRGEKLTERVSCVFVTKIECLDIC